MDAFLGPLPSFGPLGCSFGCPGEQKGRPQGIRGRSCGHRINIRLIRVLTCFWSFGPLGRRPKAFPERNLEATGALGGRSGPIFVQLFRV